MLAACLAALAVFFCPQGLDDAGYLAVADALVAPLDSRWNEAAGRYEMGGGGVETTTNANLLLVHAVAALRGHSGSARQDHRARALIRSLLASPPYTATLPPPLTTDSQSHAPGWVSSMSRLRSGQHVMVDTEAVDGLVHAWIARRQLGLSQGTAHLIARRIHAVARSRFWRWPAIRLNQINWYARIYTADAIVTGRHVSQRRALRRQIARFARGAHNLGPGLRFHYFPHLTDRVRENYDSAEYASIVASFTRFWPHVASRRDRGLLRAWLRRVVAGYWTHAGYLNWDTGLGFRRWHESKKLGLSQQALIGVAASRALTSRRWRAWAKWILDRGFVFYERQAARAGGLAPGVFFGVSVKPQDSGDAGLGTARMAANAARAVAAGLGSAPVSEPPPLYAFDPDTGRLAVTTPFYNTAIVPVSQGAFPYGGIELARLFDGTQEVAANIGGRPPAAFGLLVRDRAGRRLLATQTPRKRLGGRPLHLTRAPAGVGASPSERRAFARPFHDLRATGTVRRGRIVARTSHRFTARAVDVRWSVRGAGGDSVTILFPSWGQRGEIIAVSANGLPREVDTNALALRGIDHLCVRSAHSGYVVVPRRRPHGARVRSLVPRPQSSEPRPGPTLVVQGRSHGRFVMSVRIRPAQGRGPCSFPR